MQRSMCPCLLFSSGAFAEDIEVILPNSKINAEKVIYVFILLQTMKHYQKSAQGNGKLKLVALQKNYCKQCISLLL